MTDKKLIVEYFTPSDAKMRLIESVDGSKRTFVECLLQRAEAKNQNGRYYPKSLLIREATKYADTFIKEKRAYGELDHPDSSVVNLKNASHTVEELWWNGHDLWGKLELLNTPSGNIVREILKAGKTLGISSRGLGSVKELAEEGAVEVQDDFEIITFDIVSNPSTHGAFLKPITETINYQNKKIVSKYFFVSNTINSILKGE